MATLKMTGCMKIVAKMPQADQDALLARLDQYENDGVPRERAQVMAARDMLAEIQAERESLFSLLKEQHADLFTVTEEPAPKAQMSPARQTDTPEFKRWFGDSKVVDANGEPLVVYHGTRAEISAFDPAKQDPRDGGFWFGTAQAANQYAASSRGGGNVMPVYLKISNPKVYTSRDIKITPGLIKELESQGYDGVLRDFSAGEDAWRYPNGEREWAVFRPEQIKSAIGNNGNFDPANPDIRFSRQRSSLGFYSALTEGVDSIKTNTAPAQGWKDAIKGLVNKGQVKADEVEWSGVNDWLDLQKGKVTKEQLAEYLREGGVQVEETVLGEQGPVRKLEDDLYRMAEAAEEAGETNPFVDEILSGGSSDSIVRMAERHGGPEEMVALARRINSIYRGGVKPKYKKYQLPGGENYREVLLTLPVSAKNAAGMAQADRMREEAASLAKQAMAAWTTRGDQAEFDRLNNQSRDLYRQATAAEKAAGTETYKYQSNHWDQPNVLAHIRMNDRTDADGRRVLLVEEIQSDWGQQGKKRGFRDDSRQNELRAKSKALREEYDAAYQQLLRQADSLSDAEYESRLAQLRDMEDAAQAAAIEGDTAMRDNADQLPAAPFVTKTEGWLNLALKRIMVMAAEGGYDRVAFTTGEQNAERFSLDKTVEKINWSGEFTGNRATIQIVPKSGGQQRGKYDFDSGRFESGEFAGRSLEDVVGAEIADKIAASPSGGTLSGNGLKVEAKGMRAFYDQIVPSAIKKLLPKLGGGQMSTVEMRYDPNPELDQWEPADGPGDGSRAPVDAYRQPGFDVTDAMREKAAEGVPLFSRQRRNVYGDVLLSNWTAPTESKFDTAIRKMQDKQIDLKRVIESITAATGQIDEKWNAYLKEELYHGRTAKATKDFANNELRPLLQAMDKAGVSIADFETYLHNRHAEERNVQIAKINPAMPDGGSGIDTADARSYLAGLNPAQRQAMEALARQVDSIAKETRELLVRSGLETRDTVDTWEATYSKYVPLQREDLDFSADLGGSGTGQGFSVRGPSSKRATGSTRPVVDILANLAMQRERAIVRAEKTRVGTALYGLALKNPNPDFWLAVNPDAIKDTEALSQELIGMGLDPLDARSIAEEPRQATTDPRTGLVSYRINAALRGRDNVLAVRINGKDRFLFFNTNNERATRMVRSLKNLDADQLGQIMGGIIAPTTRWFASVNTQYNPIFGAVNLIRDTGAGVFNLSTTEIADRKAQVVAGIAGAMLGIYADLRKTRKGGQAQGQWAALWEDFQKAGAQTGYRDLFRTSEDRTKGLQAVLDPSSWADSKWGKVMSANGTLKVPMEAARKYVGAPVFNWLSDYNETLENAVRLSAYKAALDKGLSKEKAATIAKNLTVNFNRKGEVGVQAGALYAFFNASVQGTARLAETLTGPAGRKIMAGGLLLGTIQALALAAAGFDEDEPPGFIKERNLVLPLDWVNNVGGPDLDGKYLQIPMPLGLHVIPNTSRVLTEWFMSGFKRTPQRLSELLTSYLEAFNPIGTSTLAQTLSPTIADPAVAISENKDWQGRPIFKEDISRSNPTPGYTRTKDTATAISKVLAYYINRGFGGTKYTQGVWSPTPDQLDYLAAQAGGGVAREIQKISQAVQSAVTGEELPSYKMPGVGRFYGDIKEQSAVQSRFYDNITRLNEHQREVEGRRKNREGGIDEYLRENPEARLAQMADRIEREVQELRRKRREMIEKDRPKESIKMIELQITRRMQQLNERVEKLEATAE